MIIEGVTIKYNMSEKFDNILNEVKKIKKPIVGFLPTLNKSIDILPISLSQQKTIIESTIDTTVSLLNFNSNIYKIINQNTSEPQQISTVDRVNLVLTLRQQMQDSIKIDDKIFNLSSIIEKNLSVKIPQLTKTVTSDNFLFTLKVPTIEIDNKINQHILKIHKDNDEKIKGFISDLYVGEILKFVESIKILSSDTVITTSASSTANNFTILEAIDSSEFIGIIKYITDIRELEKELTRIPNTEYYVDILPDLFII